MCPPPASNKYALTENGLTGLAIKEQVTIDVHQQRSCRCRWTSWSYGADLADSYRRVAYYVDNNLQGAKPAELPVEQPTKFEFVINFKDGKADRLTVPQSVLYRADKVIK